MTPATRTMTRSALALTFALAAAGTSWAVPARAQTMAAPSPARFAVHIAGAQVRPTGRDGYVRANGTVDYYYSIVRPGHNPITGDAYEVTTGTTGNRRYLQPGERAAVRGSTWLSREPLAAGPCIMAAGSFLAHTSFEVVTVSDRPGDCAESGARLRRYFPAIARIIGLRTPPPLPASDASARPAPAPAPTAMPTDVPAPDGWSVRVSGAPGLSVTCTWEVFGNGGSHSDSETTTTPDIIDVGSGDIASAVCQKQDDSTGTLVLALFFNGSLVQMGSASDAYGVASVSGSSPSY